MLKREECKELNDRRPIKLLVITMLYEPDVVGIAAIAADMCAALAERGHDITVYTAYPFYPEWKLKCDANPWWIQDESMAGVNIRRHGLFIPSNPSRLIPRLLHELSFPLSLMRSLFDRRRFDAVMVYCPLLGSVAFAAIRKLFFREPLWVNIQDIPTEAGRNVGINRSKLFHSAASVVQKFLFNCGDVRSSISSEMVSQLEPLHSGNGDVELSPNWLTGSLAEQVQQLPSKVGRLPKRPLKLLYCGTIGKKQGLLRFCQDMSALDLDFHLRVRGDGSVAASVRRWVENSGDSRFDFSGLLPEAEFVKTIHESDLFVITEKQGAGASFLPSKLIPCISAGTPVLAVADRTGPLGREVTANELGIIVEWPQLEQIPNRLDQFLQDPQAFTICQENCYRRAMDFRRDCAIDKLEQRLLDFVSNRSEKRQRTQLRESQPQLRAIRHDTSTKRDLAGDPLST